MFNSPIDVRGAGIELYLDDGPGIWSDQPGFVESLVGQSIARFPLLPHFAN